MTVKLIDNELVFEFPEVSESAVLKIRFHRTVRIPDDGTKYPLPPSLGTFPLVDIDSIDPDRIPAHWPKRGGVVMPMWQSEAMWMSFHSVGNYPFAVKIASGKVCAITGEEWSDTLKGAKDGKGQNFVMAPKQPWLDGFCVRAGEIKQFVSVPLDTHADHTVEKQVTGKAEHGGIQIMVYPLKPEKFMRPQYTTRSAGMWSESPQFTYASSMMSIQASASFSMEPQSLRSQSMNMAQRAIPDMGLGAGGRMKQDIAESEYSVDDFAQVSSKCFISLANSMMWSHLTGKVPPTLPLTAETYARYKMPWFDYYSDGDILDGSEVLSKVKTVHEVDIETGNKALPENHSIKNMTLPVMKLNTKASKKPGVVWEGNW